MLSILFMSRCLGTVSKALLMSINLTRLAEGMDTLLDSHLFE